MSTTETQLDALAPYNDVRASIAQLKAENASKAFDLSTKPGEKAARSHIAKLRIVKADVERKRKELKADALDYGRKVDAAAKELTGEVEDMIEVHERPLLEIEQREEARKQRHILNVAALQLPLEIIANAATCRVIIDRISGVIVDASWEEFKSQGLETQANSLRSLNATLATLVKQEAEAAELAAHRKAQAERERAEQDEAIRAGAAAKAKREAEDAAMVEAKRKEAETQKAIAAEKEKTLRAQNAAEKAKREAAEAEAKAAREAKTKADAEAKRAADVKHRERILAEIADDITLYKTPSQLLEALAAGKIRHVSIKF